MASVRDSPITTAGSAWTNVTAAGLAERNDARHASHSNEPYRPQPAQDGGSSTSISAMTQHATSVLIGPLVAPYRALAKRSSQWRTVPPLHRACSGGAILQGEPITDLCQRALQGPRRQLDAVVPTGRSAYDSPRDKPWHEFGDALLAVDEDKVDGVTHEGRVDGRGAPQHQAFPWGEAWQEVQSEDRLEETGRQATPLGEDGATLGVGDSDETRHRTRCYREWRSPGPKPRTGAPVIPPWLGRSSPLRFCGSDAKPAVYFARSIEKETGAEPEPMHVVGTIVHCWMVPPRKLLTYVPEKPLLLPVRNTESTRNTPKPMISNVEFDPFPGSSVVRQIGT